MQHIMEGFCDWLLDNFLTPSFVINTTANNLPITSCNPFLSRRLLASRVPLRTKAVFGRLEEIIPIPTNMTPRVGRIIVQKHHASHEHFDISIFDEKGKIDLIRFAVSKKELDKLFPKENKPTSMRRQNNHTLEYCEKDSHTIPEGYGAGTVKKIMDEPIILHKSEPGKISFSLYQKDFTGRYALIQGKEDEWLFVKKNPLELPRIDRHEYKTTKATVKGMLAEEKVDGNNEIISISSDGEMIVNGTRAGIDGTFPNHSNHIVHITGNRVPFMSDTIMHGELFHQRGASFLSGILNSHPPRAIQTQVAEGKAILKIFDIVRYKGQDLSNLPYIERRAIYQRACKELASRYIKPVKSYNDPLAGFNVEPEGLVFKDPNAKYKESAWFKMKHSDTKDLQIVGLIPIEAKEGSKWLRSGQSSGIGAFIVDHYGTKVNVGSGLTDFLRQDACKHPEKYIGQVAEIEFLESTPSGSLRAPRFIRFHPSKSDIALYNYADGLDPSNTNLPFQLKSSVGWRRKY